jgi:cytoskeletal protein RodZ
MSPFKGKTFGPKESVGIIFRRQREAMRLSLYHASQQAGIAERYLRALEEGAYTQLPGLIYGKNFVRVYSAMLGLSAAPLVRAFAQEYKGATTISHDRDASKMATRRRWFTPMRVRVGLGLTVVALLGWYVTGEVVQLVRAPELIVATPSRDIMTTDRTLTVAGRAEAEARIMVNDRSITNRDGAFQTTVDLHEGVNTITVRAFRRHGRDHTVTRNVVRTTKEGVARNNGLKKS